MQKALSSNPGPAKSQMVYATATSLLSWHYMMRWWQCRSNCGCRGCNCFSEQKFFFGKID